LNRADPEHVYRYNGLEKRRNRILTKANSVYGPKAYLLNKLTKKYRAAFTSARLAHELKSLCSFGHYAYGMAPIARCYPICKWVYSPDIFLDRIEDHHGLFGNLY
jgi:hypothetical protein